MKMGKLWLGIVVLFFIIAEISTATNHTNGHNNTSNYFPSSPSKDPTFEPVILDPKNPIFEPILRAPAKNTTSKPAVNGPAHNNKTINIYQPHSDPNVNRMRQEIAKLTVQTSELVRKTNMLNHITKNKLNHCNNQIKKLNEAEKKELDKANESVKSLYRLLAHLSAEEKLHIKLEAELKKVSQFIQLYKLKYEIVHGNWNLLENRRLSKTNVRCREIIHALNESNKVDMNDRAGQFLENIYKHRRPSNPNLTEDYITTEINLIKKRVENAKASKAWERMKSLNKIVNENCELETRSTESVLNTARQAALTADKSKKVLLEDLKKSREFTDILRLEINDGRRIIGEFNEKLIELKRKTKGFKEDVKCYEKIEAMD